MSIPVQATQHLLDDASFRDRTTARRKLLVQLIWRERFLTRENLIDRVRYQLGPGVFGDRAIEDTFYRDMRAVKKALESASYELAYSRSKNRPGYYLKDQSELHEDVQNEIAASVGEVDIDQVAVFIQMTIEERLSLSIRMTDEIYQASNHAKNSQ